MELTVRYEPFPAAAYVRGIAHLSGNPALPAELAQIPLGVLTNSELSRIIDVGIQSGMKMYLFKKKDALPRVSAVISFLRGIQPQTLLDVGSGRGAFLLPFLMDFPDVPVTSIDLLQHRVEMFQAMSIGGMDQLTAFQQDICTWDAADNSFDVVTLLEVLEHIQQVEKAVEAAVRLARRYVVVTVPSKPDNNPEHIHLLDKKKLTRLFAAAGCKKMKFGGVNGHLMAVASVHE